MAVVTGILLSSGACTLPARACASPEIRCVGLVTGYGTIEEGIDRQAWLGLQDAKMAGMVDRIDYIETGDTRDRSANIEYFIEAGYDTIITTGAGIFEETIAAARAHPGVDFVAVQPAHGMTGFPNNLVAIEFHEEDSGFLAGATAALITRTHRVAAVCEADFIESVKRYCEGFGAGAKYADPAVDVVIEYRSGPAELLFRDSEWGSATAARLVKDGADVVFAVGETTATSALIAAANNEADVIGAETDLYEQMPEIREKLLTSALLNVRDAVVITLGEPGRADTSEGIIWGTVGLADFREHAANLGQGAQAQLMDMQAKINSDVLDPSAFLQGQ